MKLRGQSESGYAMAVLIVAMSVMAVMLTVAMPVWKQLAQREKEQELIFRGEQYARAIGLFERKYANTPPPTLDVLTQERFLRKKYKDPITNKDFVPIAPTQAAVRTPGTQTGRGGAATPAGETPAGAGRGIAGVTSSSTDKSIRIYNGATHYNEWRFVYAPAAATPGAGAAPGAAVPGFGRRGQPPQSGAGRQGAGDPFAPSGPGTAGQNGRGPGGTGPGGPARGGSGSPFPPVAPGRGR